MDADTQWPREGVPDNPRAWLTQVASRRMTDQIRRDMARRQRETAAAMEAGYVIPGLDPGRDSGEDDTLILLYMCCHPALNTSSAIALTLGAVGGLTTAEIARGHLVPDGTMAQRISRAKRTIRESGVPFRMPVSPNSSTGIAEGVELLSRALRRGAVGPYQLQAAIAAVHDEAATASDTDWPQILALYSVPEENRRQSGW